MKIHIPSDIAFALSNGSSDRSLLDIVCAHDVQWKLRWSSFLHLIGLDHLFQNAPLIDEEHMLFRATLDVLRDYKERSELEYVFDGLFTECLRIVKDVKEIDPGFLLQKMQECRLHSTSPLSEKIDYVLERYSTLLKDATQKTMHDLVLFLAWDRMCVLMKALFDHQSPSKLFACGVDVLKECLIESYIHISKKVGCKISLYRLIEALLYYFMREEYINCHTEHEWSVLSRGISILPDEDLLISNHFYIDDLFDRDESSAIYLSSDSKEIVFNRISLAVCLLQKIAEFSSFEIFSSKNITSL